jgi:hypothetical protein
MYKTIFPAGVKEGEILTLAASEVFFEKQKCKTSFSCHLWTPGRTTHIQPIRNKERMNNKF